MATRAQPIGLAVVAWTGGRGSHLKVCTGAPHRRGALTGDSGVDPQPGRAADGEAV
jgi:hypothetical protein